MATVNDALNLLCDFAPLSLAESWDNVGLLCGNGECDITSICVALDITDNVIDEALAKGSNLIVTHHPVLFPPVHTVTAQNPTTSLAYKLIKSDISVISMHTNLDACEGGVADTLAKHLGLTETKSCGKFMRIGKTSHSVSLENFADYVARKLNIPHISFVDSRKSVSKVAVAPGAFDIEFLLDAIKENVDTIVTGEAKYSLCIYAQVSGINLVIAGHHSTEAVVLNELCSVLSPIAQDVFVCKSDCNVIKTL